ncbi:MAG TPA: DUF72 domain-containing protein [Dehalococcoidia bacterium]|nr:DUF72 domain-containing protein [Dehalococcoidia bacterium]
MGATIRVGTCSWADKTLVDSGRFYPREVARKPKERLRFYGQNFDLVEVDSSFYAPPSEDNAAQWATLTPDGFIFNVKAYGLFTEHGVNPNTIPPDLREQLPAELREKRNVYAKDIDPDIVQEIYRRFESALLPLDSAGKLGVILFQFPPWFMPRHESREILRGLRDRLPQYEIAVELRSSRWFGDSDSDRTLGLLRDHGLNYVSVDEPQGFPSSVPPLAAATGNTGVVRFHGRNAETWEKKNITAAERFSYDYSEAELKEWLPRIEQLAEQSKEVHLLMNNCHEDKAVNDARQLGELLSTMRPDLDFSPPQQKLRI